MSEAKNEVQPQSGDLERVVMPFTKHSHDELKAILERINSTELSVEMLDCFLAGYKRTGDLNQSIYVAGCEWDC